MKTNNTNEYKAILTTLKISLGVFIVSGMMSVITYLLTSKIIKNPEELSILSQQLFIAAIIITAISFVVVHYLLKLRAPQSQEETPDNSQNQQHTLKYPSTQHNPLPKEHAAQATIAGKSGFHYPPITMPQLLIVDDNPANLLILKNLLSEYSVITQSATNGEEAIKHVQEIGADIIFMDIEMNNIDGIEATRSIRAHERQHNKKRCPIIGVSAHTEPEKKQQALLAGFDDYMSKPIKKSEIEESLERWYAILNINSSATNKTLHTALQEATSKQATAKRATPKDNTHQEAAPKKASHPKAHNEKAPQSQDAIDKVVDIQMSLAYSNNNQQLAKDMLNLLIKMIREEQEQLALYYKEKNWQQLSLLTHKLYGGSCYCGVPKLQKACEIADKLLQKQQHDNIEDTIETLIDAMEELLVWDDEYDIDVIFE